MRKTIALLLALLLFACVGCEAQPKPLQRTDYLLDTVVTLTLYDAKEADLDAAFKEIRRLNDLLDAYDPFSDLGWVQAAAGVKPVAVSPETMELLLFAKEMYERTGGYLDATVGPLIDLWDIRNGGHYPTESELTAALGLLGMEDLTWTKPRAPPIFLAPACASIWGPSPRGISRIRSRRCCWTEA